MNQLTSDLTASLSPIMAIIVYGDSREYYLERRNITDGQMGAGVPLTEKCLAGMSEVLSDMTSKVIHGIVPSYLLFSDPIAEHYIWYRKPEKRRMYFSNGIGIESGYFLTPGLIYETKGDSLCIYAVKSKRIGNSTKLFQAPFFNVSSSGSVCLGNAKAKFPDDLTYGNIIHYWESKFWMSKFSHLAGNVSPVKSNLSIVTKKCIETGCKFPLDELKPLDQSKVKTIKDLLK